MESHLAETGAKAPSEWVARWAGCIPHPGRVLDLACGAGRHTRYLAGLGYEVEAADRDISRLGEAAHLPGVTVRQADFENAPWPYRAGEFAGIVVANYLHRPLFPHLLASLAPGGILIDETFAAGQERYGKPTNPDFLLRPGELLEVVRGRLRVLAYEDVFISRPAPARVQRICAVSPAEAEVPECR
ncbi:MAG: methyltransferase domain-containing protein [Pseudomonadota bacterium]